MTRHALDNPIWQSLTTDQAGFNIGGPLARRYPGEVAPFAAVCEDSPAAAQELAALVEPGESIYLVALAPPLGRNWTLLSEGRVIQMLWGPAGSSAPTSQIESAGADITQLTDADTPDMIALTTLVFPGFFRPRTPDMGMYFGIRKHGRFAAMAGERMRASGDGRCHQEISAVCTHPDFVGRGYGAALVLHLIDLALQRGRSPFLHVNDSNARARALYARLGFVDRVALPLWLVRRDDPSGTAPTGPK